MSREPMHEGDGLESLRRSLDELGLPDPPAIAFDHLRWRASSHGPSALDRRRTGGATWFVAAALTAAAAVAMPVWQHSLRALPTHSPHLVGSAVAGAQFSAVAMETPAAGWAWTKSGGVWTTTDGGRRWQNVSPPIPVSGSHAVVSFAPVSARVAWIAVGGGRLKVYRTTDRGRRWTASQLAPGTVGNLGPYSLYAASARSAVLLSLNVPIWSPDLNYPETLWRTGDGGRRWTHIAVSFAAARNNTGTITLGPMHRLFLSVAAANALYVSTGGAHWRSVPYPAAPPPAARLAGASWTGALVGRPRFFGAGPNSEGIMVEQFTVNGAPASKDWVEVLTSHDGGLAWTGLTGGPGDSPLWSAASPSRWFVYAPTDSRRGTMLSGPGMGSFRQGFANLARGALDIDLVGPRVGFVLEARRPGLTIVSTASWRVVWSR
jgi:hypothetical protein